MYLIDFQSLFGSELSKVSKFKSQYYTEVFNYLNRFWKEFFVYLNYGELQIDNNLAKRSIRKLITPCNHSLHYGYDHGVDIVAIYNSVIGMVKLHGDFIWNFMVNILIFLFGLGIM